MTHSGIKDSGARFQIVPSTRKINVPTSCKTIGTVGDINSEQLTFQCPRVIDGHDIEGCADHYVTWLNANGEMGHDHLDLIEKDDECLYFAWTVRGETTTTAGVVSFSVHFADFSESGKPIYHWGTAECKECEILDTVNAVIGAFESIYVDGETLVFADHTPVRDKTLMLETPGIVPNGRKSIYTNGIHDVAEFASVDVAVSTERPPIIEVRDGGMVVASDGTPQNVTTYQLDAPTIEVGEGGTVTAKSYGMETPHKLTFADDPDFLPANIRFGKTIFGVTGTCGVETTNMTIENESAEHTVMVQYYYVESGCLDWERTGVAPLTTQTFAIAKGSQVCLYTDGEKLYPTFDLEKDPYCERRTDKSGVEFYYITMPKDKESVTVTCDIG